MQFKTMIRVLAMVVMASTRPSHSFLQLEYYHQRSDHYWYIAPLDQHEPHHMQQQQQQNQQRLFRTAKGTRHELSPFSVATTLDLGIYPPFALSPNQRTKGNGKREELYYTSTLQQDELLVKEQAGTNSPQDHDPCHSLFPTFPKLQQQQQRPHGLSTSLSSTQSPATATHTRFLRAQQKQQQQRQQQHRVRQFRVYCDLDGVLVDFCHGIRSLFPHHDATQSVDALHRPTMWQKVDRTEEFFANLPWMPDGQRLWKALQPLQPDILTGVPFRVTTSSAQKFAWCQRELGVSVQHVDKAFGSASSVLSQHDRSSSNSQEKSSVCRVITTWSQKKYVESGPDAVLIDDRIELKADWEARGGIFVHHTGCVDTTLATLEEHGILPSSSP